MKKETLLEIILGTIGGLIFSIGMCMGLISDWDMLTEGIIVGTIGFVILLCIIPVYKKEHPKKKKTDPINFGIVLAWIIGIIGALVMGYGMSKVMVDTASKSDMLIGIITGIIGLVICVLDYPIYSYIKSNK